MTNDDPGQPVATANWITHLTAFVVAAIAPVAVLGGKGMVIVLVIGGLAALAELSRQDRWDCLRKPLWLPGLMGGALLWIVIDGLFLHAEGFNWILVLKLTGVCFLGLAFISFVTDAEKPERRLLENALLTGVGLAVALIALYAAVQGSSGYMLWGSNVNNPMASVRPGTGVIAVLIWPCSKILWRRGWRLRLAVAALTAIAAITPSNSAPVALAMGGVAFVMVDRFGQKAAAALTVMAVVGVMGMPILFSEVITPKKIITALPGLPDSAKHRFYIWEFTANRIFSKPLTGWGLDSSRSIPGGNAPSPVGISLMPLHPHNAALQVWLELGLPGAVLLACLLGFIFLGGKRPPTGPPAAARAALAVTLISVAMLSFGIWQSWWLATLWLVGAVAALFTPSPRESAPESVTD